MNDNRNPTTIEGLLQKYNLSDIGNTKKAVQLQKDTLVQVENELNSFIGVATSDIANLQSQVDGNITTWFFSGEPTLSNSPASDWTTTTDKIKHLGDLYYDQSTGYAYRFMVEDNTYYWFKLTDSDLTEALALAEQAQDTADSKRRVFVIEPTSPYDVGDLWTNGTDLYKCITARTTGSFLLGEWEKATDYPTNGYIDTLLEDYVDLVTYGSDISDLQSSIDEHIITWFYTGEPALSNEPLVNWTTTELKNKHINDLYFDKNTGKAYRFDLTGSTYSWILTQDEEITEALAIANSAQDTADGKRRVFVTTPTTPYDNGDLWVNEGEILICQVSKTESETYDADDFIDNLKYTDDTVANEVDGKVTVLSGQVTTIEQGVAEITNTVTTTTTIQNNMLSDMNTLRDTISTVEETVLTQTENSFQVWLEQTGLQNTLNELSGLVDGNSTQLQTISTYFRFTLAGLEIGKSGDQVKLLISNNKISFMTGNNESAYITENKLYITDSTIITRLQLGQFVTEIDSLGNANKRWVSTT